MKERAMMSQQYKLISLPRAGIIFLCLLAGILLFVGKRSSKPDSSDKIIKHPVDTSSADVLKYWTADKMRKAKPAELPNVKTPDKGKKPPKRPRV